MNNFEKHVYLDIENYINFSYEHLNTMDTTTFSYEEIFINEEVTEEYCIDYKNYIEEAFGDNWSEQFNNISITEYDRLYFTINTCK